MKCIEFAIVRPMKNDTEIGVNRSEQPFAMVPPFDIFRVEKDGSLIWCEAAATLELAKARVEAMAASKAAQYVIYSQKTGHRVIIKPNAEAPGLNPASIN